MALPPGVRYSILRNNVEIPLIPIDQLPFKLQGLLPQLEPLQSGKEGWKLVGETQELALPLSLRAPADFHPNQSLPPAKTGFLSPDHNARRGIVITSQASQLLREYSPSSVAPTEQALHRLARTSRSECPPASMTDRTMSLNPGRAQYLSCRIPNPSGIEPDPSKKEYCTHWIRHNSCDYMQQGCRYKHEMPDREKLEELGFPQIPMWYRDKMAISAGGSSWLRPRTTQGNNDRQLSTEPPAPRIFRPSIPPHGCDQSDVVETPKSPGPEVNQASAQVLNLIDLDDSSIATPSLTLSLPVNPFSKTAWYDANTIGSQSTEHLFQTFSSSLRKSATDLKRHTDTLSDVHRPTTTPLSSLAKSSNPLASTTVCTTNDVVSPSLKVLPQMPTTESRTEQDARKINDRVPTAKVESKFTTKPYVMSEGERSIKPSKPHTKRGMRPQKPAKRPAALATQIGLADSQHATGSKHREVHTLRKDAKRRSPLESGIDLQSQIVLRQRAVHEKGESSKGVNSTDVQPRVALPVATTKVETT